MPRFAANLGFLFTEHPFLDRFAAAAAAGFSAVEFADPYSFASADLLDRLERHGLECVLLNLPMGDRAAGEMGIACLPDRVNEFRDGVARGIDAARVLRCPRLNCLAGKQPPGAKRRELWATLVDNLKFAASEFDKAGLGLSLEPINTVDVPGFLLSGSQQAVDLIREVGADNLTLQFDCYHMQMMEGDIAARIEALLPLIGHIQFGDVPGRHEPGTGTIRYDRLFPHLDRIGYRGWVSAEYRPSRRTEDTLGWKP